MHEFDRCFRSQCAECRSCHWTSFLLFVPLATTLATTCCQLLCVRVCVCVVDVVHTHISNSDVRIQCACAQRFAWRTASLAAHARGYTHLMNGYLYYSCETLCRAHALRNVAETRRRVQ